MRRGLIADTKLEASRAPVDELNRPLRLDETDSGVRVLGDDVTTVEERAGHWMLISKMESRQEIESSKTYYTCPHGGRT